MYREREREIDRCTYRYIGVRDCLRKGYSNPARFGRVPNDIQPIQFEGDQLKKGCAGVYAGVPPGGLGPQKLLHVSSGLQKRCNGVHACREHP